MVKFYMCVLVIVSLIVSTNAVNCLQRCISKLTCFVSGGTLNCTHLLDQESKTSNICPCIY